MRKILVSKCLLGVKCRYNGETKEVPAVNEVCEALDATIVAVCPETEAFGCPRPPINLHAVDNDVANIKVICVDDGKDVTAALQAEVAAIVSSPDMEDVVGFIGCRRSPSCGGAVKIHGATPATIVDHGPGFLMRTMQGRGLPIIEGQALEEGEAGRFIEEVRGKGG